MSSKRDSEKGRDSRPKINEVSRTGVSVRSGAFAAGAVFRSGFNETAARALGSTARRASSRAASPVVLSARPASGAYNGAGAAPPRSYAPVSNYGASSNSIIERGGTVYGYVDPPNGGTVSPVKPSSGGVHVVRQSALTISDRGRVSPFAASKAEPKTKSKPERAKSDISPRDKDKVACKARPEDNRPKGGGGSGKSFVPWNGTKYGC